MSSPSCLHDARTFTGDSWNSLVCFSEERSDGAAWTDLFRERCDEISDAHSFCTLQVSHAGQTTIASAPLLQHVYQRMFQTFKSKIGEVRDNDTYFYTHKIEKNTPMGLHGTVRDVDWQSIAYLLAGKVEHVWPVGRAEAQQGQQLQASTLTRVSPPEVESRLEVLFGEAEEEDFEDGFETAFTRRLASTIRENEDWAVEAVSYIILREKCSTEVASEALRAIGRMEHHATHRYRRWLLEAALDCDSPKVRDGAGLGLAYMDDVHAQPYLQEAIAKETCSELREDLKQVLQYLGE